MSAGRYRMGRVVAPVAAAPQTAVVRPAARAIGKAIVARVVVDTIVRVAVHTPLAAVLKVAARVAACDHPDGGEEEQHPGKIIGR